MKLVAVILTCLSLPLPAQDRDQRNLPANIRITAEYIEAPHTLVTQAMTAPPGDSRPALHARMRQLVQEQKARIVETSIITTRSGHKAGVHSCGEHISPIAFEPIYWIGCGGTKPPRPKDPARVRITEFTAWETRFVGSELEVDPVILSDGSFLDLHVFQDLGSLLRYEKWLDRKDHWGNISIQLPVYQALEFKFTLTVRDGRFSLVNFFTPTHKDGGPATTRKILLFVRADIIPVGP